MLFNIIDVKFIIILFNFSRKIADFLAPSGKANVHPLVQVVVVICIQDRHNSVGSATLSHWCSFSLDISPPPDVWNTFICWIPNWKLEAHCDYVCIFYLFISRNKGCCYIFNFNSPTDYCTSDIDPTWRKTVLRMTSITIDNNHLNLKYLLK